MAVLSLLLERGRAQTLSLEALHVLWWGLRHPDAAVKVLELARGHRTPESVVVRFDPTLAATVDLAIAAGISIRTSSGTIQLTETGLQLAAAVRQDSDLLASEKAFVDELPTSLTQKKIKEMLP